ncbi:MAG: response regulator [Clostridia bacterium]|nr:response regulator [Clostridia bacterium]
MKILYYIMVFSGSALMALNIFQYIRFEEDIRRRGNFPRERKVFYIPIVLLVLFFVGYIVVGIVGDPDLIVGAILFGGSIFVFVMLWFMKKAVNKIWDNEHLEVRLIAAEEASKAKTFFLSNMTHDLRTPLNAIIGYTELFKKGGIAPEEYVAYVEKIENASEQLLDIVNNVLEMSRIENGKLELEPGLANIGECVRKVGELTKIQAEEKGLSFEYSSDIEDSWAMFDSNLMNRVLLNLVSNAIKFTEKGGSVSLSVRETQKNGDTADYEFHVKDTGIGMDPDFIERLFIPFERERTSTVSKLQGTGLGLAIAKSIVDLMNGRIDVVTEKGKGSEFIVSVTMEIREHTEEKNVEKTNNVRFDGFRALLVEDNLINLEIAQILLSSIGFEIETAENGKIAVDMVSASEHGYYDVVLMDIMMPVMDGYAATKAIRALSDRTHASIPIIAMTANALKEDVQVAKESGMDGHIGKPVNIDYMISTLKTVLIDNRKAFD